MHVTDKKDVALKFKALTLEKTKGIISAFGTFSARTFEEMRKMGQRKFCSFVTNCLPLTKFRVIEPDFIKLIDATILTLLDHLPH